jgi:hypothetical protein
MACLKVPQQPGEEVTILEQLRTLSFPNNNFIGEPWVVSGVWGQWAALCHNPVRSDIHWKNVPSGPVHSGAEFIQIVHNSQGLEISWQLTHCGFRIYVVGWGSDMVICTLGKVFWSDLAWQTLIRSQHKILVLFENFRTDLLTCNTPWPQVQEPSFWPFFFVNMEPLNHFLLHVWGLQSWSLMAVQWAGNEIFCSQPVV